MSVGGAYTCRDQKSIWNVFLDCLPPYFLRQGLFLIFLKNYSYLFNLGGNACVNVTTQCGDWMINSQKSVLSFPHTHRDWSQVLRLCGKCLFLVSHLAGILLNLGFNNWLDWLTNETPTTTSHAGVTNACYCLWHIGTEDPHSDPHTYMAWTLPTGPLS